MAKTTSMSDEFYDLIGTEFISRFHVGDKVLRKGIDETIKWQAGIWVIVEIVHPITDPSAPTRYKLERKHGQVALWVHETDMMLAIRR
jgi:hypothetical protein